MAAPVRNLTDPTGVSRMAPMMPVPVVRIALPGAMVAQVMTPRLPSGVQAGTMARPIAVPAIKIPPPPLGRLIFNTFPAVYRDRAKTGNRTGQIFPRSK